MVSSIGPNSSNMVDYYSAIFVLSSKNHWFSGTGCSTCCFIATNSLLNVELSFNKYSKLSCVVVANATFSTITSLGFLLVLEAITFSMATKIGF